MYLTRPLNINKIYAYKCFILFCYEKFYVSLFKFLKNEKTTILLLKNLLIYF